MDASTVWGDRPRTEPSPRENLVRPASRPLSFGRFYAEVQQLADDSQRGDAYLRQQLVRFYDTYRFILSRYGVPQRLASFGAGAAYVEAILAAFHGTQVLVFDFPAALELHRQTYDRFSFGCVAVDLTAPTSAPPDPITVDLVLCAEIVEHLPVPPAAQFAENFKRLGSEPPMVVTTPNASSLRHMMKLLFMRPLLQPAELVFSDVSFENEGVHRREYVPSEIHAAFAAVGHTAFPTAYTWYHRPGDAAERVLYPLEMLVPRFRPCMIIGSRPR